MKKRKIINIVGTIISNVFLAAAVVLAILSAVFGLPLLDYIAIALVVVGVLMLVVLSCFEINSKPEKVDNEDNADDLTK